MNEPFYDETYFFVPARSVWKDFCEGFPADEDSDCDAAENVLDDIILFEVNKVEAF